MLIRNTMKHHIKVLFFTLLLVICFGACDDREDVWNAKDVFSTYTLKKEDNTPLYQIESTCYDTLKVGTETRFLYNIERNEDCTFMLTYDTTKEEFSLDQSSRIITYKGLSEGQNNVSFEITDPWNQKKTYTLQIYNRVNKAPIASAQITHEVVTGGYQITIDARNSYDVDSNLGGKIVTYKYEITNVTIQILDKPFYNHLFSLEQKGTFNIYVTVQDNDGEWSLPTGYQYTIN